MGIFSTQYQTVVETSVSRVVPDEIITDPFIETIMTSVIGKFPMNLALKEKLVNGTFRNFERMYEFAEKGNYVHGLPNLAFHSTGDGANIIKEHIENELGKDIELIYAHFRPYNHTHHGWKVLTNAYQYDHNTNEIVSLSLAKGVPVYLEYMVAHYRVTSLEISEPDTMRNFEESSARGGARGNARIIELENSTEEELANLGGLWDIQNMEGQIQVGPNETNKVVINYLWVPDENKPDEILRESIELSLEHIEKDIEYHQAKYTYSDQGIIKVGYWDYRPDPLLGSIPALNDLYDKRYSHTSPGTFFPLAIFRREYKDVAREENRDSHEYKSTKDLLNIINVDFQQVADAINDNDGIDDVAQAVMMMGVPLNSTDPLDIEYLFDFFEEIALNQGGQVGPSKLGELLDYNTFPGEAYALSIGDADFTFVISFASLEIKYIPGKVNPNAKVGDYTNQTVDEEYLRDLGYRTNTVTQTLNRKAQLIRKQVMDSVYREIRIVSPVFRYDIYTVDNSDSPRFEMEGKWGITSGSYGIHGGADDERMLIPLNRRITDKFTPWKREQIYLRSLHFIFNSHVEQRLEWYETSVFKAVVTFIAVVITVYSSGTSYEALVAASTLGATAVAIALIKIVLTYLVRAFIVNVVFTYLIKVFGIEIAFIAAVVALVYGGYKALSSVATVTNSLADNMLWISSNLTQAINVYLQDQSRYLLTEIEEFKEYSQNELERLQEAQGLLDTGNDLITDLIIKREPMIIFGETPTQLFDRTIHVGNIGTLSFDFVEKYVDNSLKLPDIIDTLGGIEDE